MDFYKVITPKAFDLEQVIDDHRQVGQAGKNGDAPKKACLNFRSVLNAFISGGPRKLNYRGRIFLIFLNFFTFSLLMVYFYY